MQPIVQWLEGLGLGQYGEPFVQADIDFGVLPDLTEADLEKLGVTLGFRCCCWRRSVQSSHRLGSARQT